MSLLDTYIARTEALEAAWAAEHGPWGPPGTWPPHPTANPCMFCWSAVRLDEKRPATLDGIARATTFIDEYEGRYLVCERHWRERMREQGYRPKDLRRLLVEQGGFSEAEADAMLAEDRNRRRRETLAKRQG